MMKNVFAIPILLILLQACGTKQEPALTVTEPDARLPFLGKTEYTYAEDGRVMDSTLHQIPPFSFIDQDGNTVNEKTVEGKIYVADFFFTTCPSICPIMTGNLKKVQTEFNDNPDVLILSHSIDPEYDNPDTLKKYAADKGADTRSWKFLTGNKDTIYDICENFYMAYAKEDKQEEGGYVHSGFLILVDKNRHIRGAYDGTNEGKTEDLIRDMYILLKEK